LIVNAVFPTPPFWLQTAAICIICGIYRIYDTKEKDRCQYAIEDEYDMY
jgi:hypothetical protein